MCLDKTVRRRKETRSGRKLQSRLLLAQSNRLPRLLCPQALLLLGLNSISASLQDQHCESLSVASNISGEHAHLPPARFQVPRAPPPISPRAPTPTHGRQEGRDSGGISSLGLQAIHHLSTECHVE